VNLLIRRSGQVVQDRLSPVVGWADIPELSTCVGCCPAAWLQSWLQSRRNGGHARGSGGGRPHLPNLFIPPAWTRSLVLRTPKIIPCMFRIMAACAPACRGWPASSPGRLRPGPWFLTGVSAEVSGVKRDFACTFTLVFPPALVALRGQSRLGLEGRTRTLSGPSPDLDPAKTLAPSARLATVDHHVSRRAGRA